MTFTQMTPIIGVAGMNEEPALTICNNVMQRFIQKPYNWKFNSTTTTGFYTVASASVGANPVPFPSQNCPNPQTTTAPFCTYTQDYTHNYTDIAWIEASWKVDCLSTAQPQPILPIEADRNIQPSSDVGDPRKIANMYANDAGGIFRLWPVPSIGKQWQVFVTYQKKVPQKQGLQETWYPLPDELNWVVNLGFMAEAYRHADDPRWVAADAKFVAAIMQASGFEDSEANAEQFVPDFGLFLG